MGWIVIGQTNKKIHLNKLQRALRNNMSDAEQVLWNVLRRRQVSGLKFRRQHPFADYILDFVCLENRLVIEVDGGQHGKQVGYDENRTQELQAAGFYVLRFWNNEVLKEIESVREKIWLVVQELRSHPLPNLPLEGGGIKKVSHKKKIGKVISPPIKGGEITS
jgi:adenine-specific DNA-methyltransferase